MISVEVSGNPDPNWNQNLLGSKYGTVYQTVEYAQYIQDRMKSKPIYLKFTTSSGELAAQLILFQSFKGRGKLAKHLGQDFLYSVISKPLSLLLPRYIYWNFGPVVFNVDLQKEISEYFANFLISLNCKFKGTSHPLDDNFDFPQKFNFQKQDNGTFIIDLSQSLEEILKNTDKKSVKKNIERAQERGVIIKEIKSKNDILVYHTLLNQHRLENKISSYSLDDIVKAYRFMESLGQKGFLALHDGIPVGGILFSSFNKYINEMGIARSRIDTENKLYSLDLLRWKIIEYGKYIDANYYDLSGIIISDRSQKEQGLFQNKKKWGGKLVIYPTFSNS